MEHRTKSEQREAFGKKCLVCGSKIKEVVIDGPNGRFRPSKCMKYDKFIAYCEECGVAFHTSTRPFSGTLILCPNGHDTELQ